MDSPIAAAAKLDRRQIIAASFRFADPEVARMASVARDLGARMGATTQPSVGVLLNAGQFSSTNTGSALANSAALTDISPGANVAGQAYQLGAGLLLPGTILRVHASGIFSAVSAPTLLLGLYYGAVAGTALGTTGAVTTNNATNGTWVLDATIRCATVGATGTVLTQGVVQGIGAAATTPTLLPATSASGGSATIATGVANLLTLGAQWGTGAAGNTITCYQWLIYCDS